MQKGQNMPQQQVGPHGIYIYIWACGIAQFAGVCGPYYWLYIYHSLSRVQGILGPKGEMVSSSKQLRAECAPGRLQDYLMSLSSAGLGPANWWTKHGNPRKLPGPEPYTKFGVSHWSQLLGCRLSIFTNPYAQTTRITGAKQLEQIQVAGTS